MFDYLAVLIAIILGLALTHLLRGLTRLIELRHRARIYWVQVVWTLDVTLYVLAVWWGMYWWKGLHEWTFQLFLFLSVYAITMFMLASLLFPHECDHETDFEAHFFEQRKWFFGQMFVTFLLDIPETVGKTVMGLRAFPHEYPAFLAAILLIAGLGFLTDNRRVHRVLPVAWLLATLAYEILSLLDRVVVAG